MAEFGAHLTSTRLDEDEDGKPDIFEVLAQENLMTSLKPALSHTLRVTGLTYSLIPNCFKLNEKIICHQT